MILLKRLSSVLLLFLIVTLFYWKLVLTDQYTWLEFPDLALQVLPWFQFQASEWHHGHFPLWDQTAWMGQPLFGQGQPGAAYPLNWLLFLWPLRNGWIQQAALHWYFVLIRFLASLTAYAFCRSLGRSRRASIVGGCVYALGGYVANTDWPQMVNGAVWTPLAFLFLFKVKRNEKPWHSAVLSGFFLGFGWLAGHHQMNLFASLAALGMWTWWFLRERRPDWKIARLAALSLTVAFCAGALQTLPMAEYGKLAVRWTGSPDDPIGLGQSIPYSVHEQYQLKPHELLGLFLPSASEGFRPFAGVAACALAFLGFALGWRREEVRWLGALVLGGVVFALGGNSLFHGWAYSLLPLVDKARVPEAATLVLSLGLAPLAAFGLDLWFENRDSIWLRRTARVLAGVALLIGGIALSSFLLRTTAIEERVMITALAAALLAGLLTGARIGLISARLSAAVVLGLILFELSMGAPYYLPNRFREGFHSLLAPLSKDSELAAFLGRQDGEGRVEYSDEAIPYNLGDWYGLESFNNRSVSLLEHLWNVDLFSRRMRDFFGVRYYVGDRAQSPEQIEVFKTASGLKVFENPGAFPRAWAVHDAKTAPDLIRARVLTREADLSRTAVMTGSAGPGLESCAGDKVEVPIHQANFVHIAANLECRGLVVLSDAWYPGWKAMLDGAPVTIEEVDGAFRGVVVPKGPHTIDMKYRPGSVIAGGVLTLAAALAALASCMAGLVRDTMKKEN
jgi:hypothetical protein